MASGSTLIASPPIDDRNQYFSPSRKSSYAGSRRGSTYEASKTTNIQPQMNMALSVAENFIGKSPSLRRVSVNHEEAPKSGLFGKKKAQEPSLVFTFTAEDLADNNNDYDDTDMKSVFSDGSIQNFNLKANSQDMDHMKLGSVASYKTTHTQASTLDEEL